MCTYGTKKRLGHKVQATHPKSKGCFGCKLSYSWIGRSSTSHVNLCWVLGFWPCKIGLVWPVPSIEHEFCHGVKVLAPWNIGTIKKRKLLKVWNINISMASIKILIIINISIVRFYGYIDGSIDLKLIKTYENVK